MQFKSGQHVHFVGIGGFGLSAIARILLERGYTVSGSDRDPNALAQALGDDGATVFTGHNAANIAGADLLIISSAVQDNPEVQAANQAGIPVYKRQDIMAALMQDQQVIAVSGTHGKTTTTAMITYMLAALGEDPSAIVGGIMANTGTNARLGQGNYFVVEADEYDNMFHGLQPDIAILTGIEYDHPDFFTSHAQMMECFRIFINKLADRDGLLIACSDNLAAKSLAAEFAKEGLRVHYYGLDADADLRAESIRIEANETLFDVYVGEMYVRDVRLGMAGKHNIQNALAALSLAYEIGRLPEAAAMLADFKGTGRRFEIRGEVNGVVVVDDYAHHPTAIQATLEAARSRYPDRTLWAVWQPHTFSRTEALIESYATAFAAADHVIVTDIYQARESPPSGLTNTEFTAKMVKRIQHKEVRHIAYKKDVGDMLLLNVTSSAIIVIMSAGDGPHIATQYLAESK